VVAPVGEAPLHTEVRLVGDCEVIFFLIESQSCRLSGRTVLKQLGVALDRTLYCNQLINYALFPYAEVPRTSPTYY
jgi:hypothetical protein